MKIIIILVLSILMYMPLSKTMGQLPLIKQTAPHENQIDTNETIDDLISKNKIKWRRKNKVLEANFQQILKNHDIVDQSILFDDQTKIAFFKFKDARNFESFFDKALDGSVTHEELIKAGLDLALFQSKDSQQRLNTFKKFGIIVSSLAGNAKLAILKKIDSIDEEFFEYIIDRKEIDKIVAIAINQLEEGSSNIYMCDVGINCTNRSVTKPELKNSVQKKRTLQKLRVRHQKVFIDEAIIHEIEYFICHVTDSSGFNFLLGNNAQNIIAGKNPFVFNSFIGIFHLRDLYPQYKKTVMLLQDCRSDASGLIGPVFFGLDDQNKQLSQPSLQKHEDRARQLAIPGKYKIVGLKVDKQLIEDLQKKVLEYLMNSFSIPQKK